MTYTYTSTRVYDTAPCGCRLPVPNEAFERRAQMDVACDHDRLWSVQIIAATVQGSFDQKAVWVEVVR